MKTTYTIILTAFVTSMLIPSTANAVAGVRRRTACRTAVVVSSATKASAASQSQQQTAAAQQQTATAQQQTATAQQQTAEAQQAAAAPAAAAPAAAPTVAAPPPASSGKPLPLGTIVSALPPGCVGTPVNGVEYYYGGGNFYRAVFQGNQLVYVTAKPE